MTTIFGPRQKWVAMFLIERDGNQCQQCPAIDNLIIDHIDGNRRNRDPSNLRLLCRSCNFKTALPKEREREKLSLGEQRVRRIVDYSSGSVEMQANEQFEPEYRNWLIATLKFNREITKKEAINAGAERVECSTTTARKYLDKMVSAEGPCRETKNQDKQRVIRLKEGI